MDIVAPLAFTGCYSPLRSAFTKYVSFSKARIWIFGSLSVSRQTGLSFAGLRCQSFNWKNGLWTVRTTNARMDNKAFGWSILADPPHPPPPPKVHLQYSSIQRYLYFYSSLNFHFLDIIGLFIIISIHRSEVSLRKLMNLSDFNPFILPKEN